MHLLLLLLGCRPGPTTAAPSADTGSSTAPDTTPSALTLGDPIGLRGYAWPEPESTEDVLEWLDAAILDSQTGLLIGAGGLVVVELDAPGTPDNGLSGVALREPDLRGFLIDVEGETAYVGTRWYGLYTVDISDRTRPRLALSFEGYDGFHEDIDVHNGQVLVAWQEHGAVLLDAADLTERAVLPAEDASAAVLSDERAWVVDGRALTLWDLSGSPVVLETWSLPAQGSSLAVSAEHVVVGLGGAGLSVFARDGDALTDRGQLSPPGAVNRVALEGDYAWFSAWSVVGGVWLGGEAPTIIGLESPPDAAMSIAAAQGEVLVADWNVGMVLDHIPGVGGPEVTLPGEVWVPAGSTEPQRVTVRNDGAFPLSFSIADAAWPVEPTSLTLSPGEQDTLTLTPDGVAGTGISWSSDDPDEASGLLKVSVADTTIGQPHPDFTLSAFTVPDNTLTTVSLSDHRGQVVVLDYFASW